MGRPARLLGCELVIFQGTTSAAAHPPSFGDQTRALRRRVRLPLILRLFRPAA